MFGLSFWEMGVVLLVALLAVGPRRIPELMRSIGKTLRDLRRASSDLRSAIDAPLEEIRAPLREIQDDLRSSVGRIERDLYQEQIDLQRSMHQALESPPGSVDQSSNPEPTDRSVYDEVAEAAPVEHYRAGPELLQHVGETSPEAIQPTPREPESATPQSGTPQPGKPHA